MRTRIAITVAAVFASVALLATAASAQAAWRQDNWCTVGAQHTGVTLKPGQYCTSWPLNVGSFGTSWKVTKAGRGRVILALTKYGSSTPVSGAPGPTSFHLTTEGDSGAAGAEGLGTWPNCNGACPTFPYGVYGQARIINYSSATIQLTVWNWLNHWQ
jgi:hypothetical protein